MPTDWQINTANTGTQLPGVASLLANQATTPIVGDTQYRGEPLAPADPNATSYSSVGMAAPPAVAAPVAATAQNAFTANQARKELQDWLDSGGSFPVEQTEGGTNTGMVEVGDLTFQSNPDYYGGGYQAQRGNVTYAFDPNFNLQQSYTQDGKTVNTYDPQGNLIRSYTPQTGFGNFLKTVAPIALSFAAPGLGTMLGGGLTGTIGAGALIGGGTAALTGGNVLKGAALGGLGAGVSSGIGSLTSGLDPAIVKAAQGAGSSLVRGAVTGNFDPTDILASAGTGYLSDSVRSVLEDFSPTQNLYEQNIAPGIKPETSVAGFIENIGRNAAINAPGTLIRGGDLGDMLTNTAIGEAAKTATGYVPKTGDDFIDRLTGGATSALVSSGLRDIVAGEDKGSTAPKPVASADKATSPRTGSQEQVLSELMAMLGGGTSGGSQYFAPTNDYDLGRAFSAARATREAAARNRQMETQIAALLGRRLSEV